MKGRSSISAWWLVGSLALAILNLLFFLIVIGADILFATAPQFVVPLLVPSLVLTAFLVLWLTRNQRSISVGSVDARHSQADERPMIWSRVPSLHSVVIIRRRNSSNSFCHTERTEYEATI
jgi:hypothetical protein